MAGPNSDPESTLTSHVNALRKAIGDSGKNQKVILTVPRKGFRFVAQVREAKAAAASILPRRFQPCPLRWHFPIVHRSPLCRSSI